ncbi:MAG TPA: phosphotransferase [Oscillospiraceae bacterium]|nr:phosphotransferase [Oscillospiraceae bacterium]HPK34447.1 phosphotransferase [Oscillospiraceae bacterium]HPR76427.1 phosphotransferase [Oscillospiraceae bacterium]
MEKQILEAARAFGITGEIADHTLIKTGNINQTNLVKFSNGKEYIIQRVNTYVFRDPDGMMRNIAGVTAHLRRKCEEKGLDCRRQVLNFCGDATGKLCHELSDGSVWRAYDYIGGAVTYDSVPNTGLLTSAGEAFGNFSGMLADYDMESLVETIPNFHDTEKRYEAFETALKADCAGRAKDIKSEIGYLQSQKAFCSKLVQMRKNGVLPERVTHNDTKYNNVLIDISTQKPAAIIDLDTVMPGLAAYDFGDAIRFAANTSLEDEPDISKTALSLEYYEAFAKGYVGVLSESFDETELMSLPTGALMMTVELALRFCTDYLMGDPYFKLNYPEHNLVRTRCQIALAKDMEKKFSQMEKVIRKYM